MKRKIEATGSIEVFQNQNNTISIKQEDLMGEESVVVIHPTHARMVSQWILDVAEEIEKDRESGAD